MSGVMHEPGTLRDRCIAHLSSFGYHLAEFIFLMKKRITWIVASGIVPAVVLFGVGAWFFLRPQEVPELTAAQPAVQTLVDEMLTERKAELLEAPDEAFGSDDEINILTLGIDSRKEGHEQHCDALHLITLNVKEWTIKITSVPRGTYAALPPGGTYKDTDYYLSNACAFGGLDYGIAQIQKVTGVKADYVATVGFSQALGIFRVLGLPTTDTLQWLRHRQSYAIGDPQRSQNQATFMKDVALQLLSDDGISTPLLYILYTFVDTDLTFDQVHALYLAYLASDIAEHPERVTFDMKPYFETQIYHLDTEDADAQITSLLESLEGRLSSEDLSNKSLEEIQQTLTTYLYDMLGGTDDEIFHVFHEQLWSQVEDETMREELHYRYLGRYVDLIKDTDRESAVQAVTDYVLEMQFFGLTDWETRGKNLMATIVEGDIPASQE